MYATPSTRLCGHLIASDTETNNSKNKCPHLGNTMTAIEISTVHANPHYFPLFSSPLNCKNHFSIFQLLFWFHRGYFKPETGERQSLYAFQDKTFLNAHTAATNDATCAAEHPTCSGPWWWKLCPSVESPVSSSHCTAHGSTVNTSTPSTFNSHYRWESEEVEGDVWHLTPLISL